MCKKVMQSTILLTFGVNYKDKTNYPSYIFTRDLTNQIIMRRFENFT